MATVFNQSPTPADLRARLKNSALNGGSGVATPTQAPADTFVDANGVRYIRVAGGQYVPEGRTTGGVASANQYYVETEAQRAERHLENRIKYGKWMKYFHHDAMGAMIQSFIFLVMVWNMFNNGAVPLHDQGFFRGLMAAAGTLLARVCFPTAQLNPLKTAIFVFTKKMGWVEAFFRWIGQWVGFLSTIAIIVFCDYDNRKDNLAGIVTHTGNVDGFLAGDTSNLLLNFAFMFFFALIIFMITVNNDVFADGESATEVSYEKSQANFTLSWSMIYEAVAYGALTHAAFGLCNCPINWLFTIFPAAFAAAAGGPNPDVENWIFFLAPFLAFCLLLFLSRVALYMGWWGTPKSYGKMYNPLMESWDHAGSTRVIREGAVREGGAFSS